MSAAVERRHWHFTGSVQGLASATVRSMPLSCWI